MVDRSEKKAEKEGLGSQKRRRWTPQKWTLLWVGDLGRIKSFEVSRFLLLSLLLTVGFLVVYAVGMTLGFYRVYSVNDALENRLAAAGVGRLATEEKGDADEVPLMLPGKEAPASSTPNIEERVKADPPASEASQVAANDSPVPSTADTEELAETDGPSEAEEPSESTAADRPVRESEEETVVQKVRVENFRLWPVNDSTAVRFKFKLENASPIDIKIRGYTFVALEPAEGEEEPVRVAPWSPLKDGKPSLIKRGQYFGISRFKYVQVTLPDVVDVTRFESATVYVYSETGTLLHQQVWPVEDVLRS